MGWQFDIKVIAAPNLQPVYLNPIQAAQGKLQADSIIRDATIRMSGKRLSVNNRFKGGTPFIQVDIPNQAFICKDPESACYEGLIPTTPNSSCPLRYTTPGVTTKYIGMAYADYDNDNTTYSSSMAQLDISQCSEIESAYLYWTGNFKGIEPSITLVPSNLNTFTGNGANVYNTLATSLYKSVMLKKPGGVYQTVTALKTYTDADSYVCVSDITSMLQGLSGGQFWVGNIQSYPLESNGIISSGWTLVVVYKSILSSPKLISLWDGLLPISTNNSLQINLTGFTAPSIINAEAYIGLGVLDGDNNANELDGLIPEGIGFQTNAGGPMINLNPYCNGDQPKYKLWTTKGYPATCDMDNNLDLAGCRIPQFDANWCSVCDGISSSHISTYDPIKGKNGNEILRLPSNVNTFGYDTHLLKLPSGSVAPNATTATLTIQAGPQGTTIPFMAFLAVERTQPKLILTKTSDKNVVTTSGSIKYNIAVKNAGNVNSLGGDKIIDTLDLATTYKAGTLVAKNSAGNVISDVVLDSQANNTLIINIGSAIKPNDYITISFDVNVLSYASNTQLWDLNCKRTITNSAYAVYKTLESSTRKSRSNSDDCGIGPETKVLVQDPLIISTSHKITGPINITSEENILIRVKAILLKSECSKLMLIIMIYGIALPITGYTQQRNSQKM